ncbi:helix-turn-helix domain-containing protein [Methanolobus vulcani]|uniref:Helix-turn-helix transcriptional regulator n=1 Tax=Methanolobus vulcani TaxID=38026 RepID=A0A7Z8KMX0_9EURY|nr:helix-turn-helix domain-containing protein [Methanolobus vulcani]TQD25090.1 helix-turn-helix transcriptional regulator [Methanolobus vulcani]
MSVEKRKLSETNKKKCNETNKQNLILIFKFMGKKWTLPILGEFYYRRPLRFTELRNELKMNPKLLSTRLKEMESYGILERKAYKELPPRVEYSLTPKGVELLECFEYLGKWTQKWME